MSDKNLIILMYNHQEKGPFSPRWDLMPDEIWFKILEGFFYKICDGVGFRCGGPAGLKLFECFQDWQPEFIDYMEYMPESIPPTVSNLVAYKRISVFKFDLSVLTRLKAVPFSVWNVANDDYPTDEIVFFKGRITKGRAVPYEAQIWFENLTEEEMGKLGNLAEVVKDNLWMPAKTGEFKFTRFINYGRLK